ncbi:MAG: stage II sporulation protein M [Lachnospiraceae bacterium]|nr:stage II sporulation protein M [Lachnospiraceae bacterium]
MRLNRYYMHNGKLPLGSIFLFGVIGGILVMNFGKSILLENTGLLDEYTLYHMKYMTVDSSALFYYVLGKRMKTFVLLVVLATTYLGLLVCAGTTFWYGFSTGAFLAALMIRYGVKGILFAFFAVFPQYILYIPAMLFLLIWCDILNRGIYFKTNLSNEAETGLLAPKRILKLIGILVLALLGCLLESFVNPDIMGWLLTFF